MDRRKELLDWLVDKGVGLQLPTCPTGLAEVSFGGREALRLVSRTSIWQAQP